MRTILLFTATTLATLPGAAQRQDAEVPAAVPAGEAVDCVWVRNIRSTKVHGDRVIDFRMNGGQVYRNTLPVACPGLGFEERFSYRLSTSQLCSVDTIQVIRAPGISAGASCGLGPFQPVTLAQKR